MANIIAHDNAIFVDAEDKTLDKVLKQTQEDIIATAEAVASEDNLANVKIGDNINVTEDGTISVQLATNNEHGVIIPGIGLNIDNQTPGQLDISIGDGLEATYQGDMSLKKATTNSLGGIIVGTGLDIALNGTLSNKYAIDCINIHYADDNKWHVFASEEPRISYYINSGLANVVLLKSGDNYSTILECTKNGTSFKTLIEGTVTTVYYSL